MENLGEDEYEEFVEIAWDGEKSSVTRIRIKIRENFFWDNEKTENIRLHVDTL